MFLLTSGIQVRIEITVSGSIFSGDGLVYGHSTLPAALAEENYLDYVVDATFATFTFIQEVSASFSGCTVKFT